VDFELTAAAREAEGRAASLLEAEAGPVAALPGLDPAGWRRLLLAAQGALAGEGGGQVAARLLVARASPALLLAIEATRHLGGLLAAFGREALPAAEAAALARGERVGAVARADAAGGGAARLWREGDGWRLRAEKAFVTNGPAADWIAVFAESEGREAVCLVSPRDAGVRPGPRLELMGLDGLAVSALSVEEARLPAARVLGPFDGRPAAERYGREADLSVAVAAAGLTRSVLQAANRHAHRHLRDGRPAFARQEVAFKLAEVLALAEAAELACHRAAWLLTGGAPEAGRVARCAKVFCAESAERAASACLQVMAGEGYRRGSPAERAWRDAKGLALCGTTVEVARMAIADELLSRA
jgi:alkylation response protein AidB-like acyl-CoA dehydrogenase